MRHSHTWCFLAFFSVIALLNYFPILSGKIPFPAQVATGFPPWDETPSTIVTPPNRAEYGDTASLFYPWRYFQKTGVYNWELPLWNPHILSGNPFLGDTESALFYPLNATFYVLPLVVAWPLKLALNVVIAGTLTAFFVRLIGGSVPGAIAAGVVFALAGNMTTWQASNNMDAMLWLPLVFLGTYRLCSNPDATSIIITAAGFALPMLAGHPETVAHLAVAGGAFALWQSFASGGGTRVPMGRIALFAVAGLLAMGLSSIQLIPTLEWLPRINHTLESYWGTLKIHQGLSFFSRDIATNPNSRLLIVPESASYAGALTLLVAPLALLHRSKREVIFFLIGIAVALQIVFGGPVAWVIARTPIISGLKNWRFLVPIDFALAVLAGLGITAVSENVKREKLARLYLWLAPMVSFVIASYGIWLMHKWKQSNTHWLSSNASFAVLLLIGCALLLIRIVKWISPQMFAVAAVALIAIDLVTYAHGYLPFAPPHEIYPSAPLFDFLKQHDPDRFRVANLDFTYGPNAEMMYGLHSVGGYDVGLKLTKEFLGDVSAPTLDDVSLDSTKIAANNDRRLDMLAARFLIANTYNNNCSLLANRPDRFSLVFSRGRVCVFENRFALPRAFFVPAAPHAVEVLSDDAAQLSRVKDPAFDPQRMVVVGTKPSFSNEPATTANDPVPVQWLRSSANEIELSIGSARPGILVLSQIYYPGWHAVVDGVETPVFRANYALTGVALESRVRSVKFVYRPMSYRVGMIVTIMSIAAALVLAIFYKRTWRATRFS